MVEISATEYNTEKKNEKNEDSLRDLWGSITHTDIHIAGVLEGDEREKGPRKYWKR